MKHFYKPELYMYIHNLYLRKVDIIWALSKRDWKQVSQQWSHVLSTKSVIHDFFLDNINGLVQDCSNSIANALELLQSCTKPLISGSVSMFYVSF